MILKGDEIFMFTAHISNDKERIQTVREHCLGTAERCAGYCSVFGAENIGRLAGLLHDAGKLCTDFDSYIKGDSRFRRGDIDHCFAGAKYLMETADEKYKDTARLISRVILSHHGLHDWVDEKPVDYFRERLLRDKNYQQIKENIPLIAGENELMLLLEKADDEFRAVRKKIIKLKKNKEECAFYVGMLERILTSALIDADRSDTASFMENTDIPDDRADAPLWNTMKDNMQKKLDGFADRKDIVSRQRMSISDRCKAHAGNDVHICRLIVPTGGGKTLSSLRFAIEYCLSHGMERIVYSAPFMSILEQNSDEIRSIAGEENFIEHHSGIIPEKADETEEFKEYELCTERWDKPVIATTMVQLLNSMFLGKTTAVRRFHRLAKSVMIIDEVQSLPLKCVNIFDLALNFLSYICGASVVLCTATQPVNDEVKYPVILDEKKSMTGDHAEDFNVFRRTEIVSLIDKYGSTYEEAAAVCAGKFREAGDLLVIVNTKSSARKMYDLIKEECSGEAEVIHLSTNMCPLHRREKIESIRSMLKEKKPVICVTTQLIEAGVDISFRCVVRSLAGLDSAVQAAGRCNRHGENEAVCPVYLIKLKEEKLGSLKEILSGQSITQRLLNSGKYNDLSSPEAVEEYFREAYNDAKNELSYNVPENDTLMNLLSLNKKRYETSGRTSDAFESQAFKTAGSFFKVIDNKTSDMIVPYDDEAEKIIASLENGGKATPLLLRKAQKYTVSVYMGTENSLKENNAFRILEGSGVRVLDKRFYNDEIGIDIEGAEQEVLIF